MASNKYVISADLENIGQGQDLQLSLYLSYYIAAFNQNVAIGADNKSITLADLESVGHVTFHKE